MSTAKRRNFSVRDCIKARLAASLWSNMSLHEGLRIFSAARNEFIWRLSQFVRLTSKGECAYSLDLIGNSYALPKSPYPGKKEELFTGLLGRVGSIISCAVHAGISTKRGGTAPRGGGQTSWLKSPLSKMGNASDPRLNTWLNMFTWCLRLS